MEQNTSKAHRIARVAMSISSLAMAIYGVSVGQWRTLVVAALWYVVGGMLVMMIVTDLQELRDNAFGTGKGEGVHKSVYDILDFGDDKVDKNA